MFEKIALIILILVILSHGCQPHQTTNNSSGILSGKDFDLANFLTSQNLPTVIGVEEWKSQFGDGLKIQTSHYEIFTTLKDPLMLRDVPAFLENCQGNFRKLFSSSTSGRTNLRLYLFDNRTQWQTFTTGFAGSESQKYIQIKAGAYYLKGCCVAYNIGRERTFYALGHECWHQFADENFKFSLPSWLNEGLAMQFETNYYKEGFFYFVPAYNVSRLDSLKKSIKENQMIPLDILLETNPGDLLGNDKKLSAFYSECYALIRFLQESNGAERRQALDRLLTDGLNGKWNLSGEDRITAADKTKILTVALNKKLGPQIFNNYFGSDINSINNEFMVFCKDISAKK